MWNTIAAMLSRLSFGSITMALFIFKISSLIIHLINCLIIKKLTKSNKYMLLYGINPLVLLELLSNVHNDIYLIFFVLLSLYFLIKKKNICLTILFLILSIALKYSTVLIVPFILLYCFRKKTLPKRILWCCLTGIIIVLFVILLYMPFYRDITIFTNMLAQDGKYSQSIMALLMDRTKANTFFRGINKFRIPLFAIIYCIILIKSIFNRNSSIKHLMKNYNLIMLVFIFICLTTFQRWYVLWLLPTIIWQNKNMRYFIINITITGMIPLFTYFKVKHEIFRRGLYYSLMMIVLAVIFTIAYKILKRMRKYICQD